MSEMVTLLTMLNAKPEQAERVERIMGAMIDPSRTNAGCIAYSVYRSKRDPNVWVMYEIWRSKKDLDEHTQSKEFQNFVAVKSEVLANDIDFHSLTMTNKLISLEHILPEAA